MTSTNKFVPIMYIPVIILLLHKAIFLVTCNTIFAADVRTSVYCVYTMHFFLYCNFPLGTKKRIKYLQFSFLWQMALMLYLKNQLALSYWKNPFENMWQFPSAASLEQTQGHWVKVVIYHSGWEFLDAHWQIV